MNSQEDLFADIPSKKVKYDYLVLCDKDEGVKHPFASFPRCMFSPREILDRWLDSILDDSSRVRSLTTLDKIPDKQFALFGKFEEGVSADLRESTVNSLNKQYENMRESGETQTSTLVSLVQRFPYRLLSKNLSKKVRNKYSV